MFLCLFKHHSFAWPQHLLYCLMLYCVGGYVLRFFCFSMYAAMHTAQCAIIFGVYSENRENFLDFRKNRKQCEICDFYQPTLKHISIVEWETRKRVVRLSWFFLYFILWMFAIFFIMRRYVVTYILFIYKSMVTQSIRFSSYFFNLQTPTLLATVKCV